MEQPHARASLSLILAAVLGAALSLGCPIPTAHTPPDKTPIVAPAERTAAWTDTGLWPEAGFSALDASAKAASGATIQALAADIIAKSGASGDLAKARAIYAWVTGNIAYDGPGLRDNTLSIESQMPNAVLGAKIAVCEGYSRIFKALCDSVGLVCTLRYGYSKGYGFDATKPFDRYPDHAWNLVTIGGSRYIVDTTWGAGNLDTAYAFHWAFSGFWFQANPDLALYSHMPADDNAHPILNDELVLQPISLAQYAVKPNRPSYQFSDLYDLGVESAAIARSIASGLGLPAAYANPVFGIRLEEAPLCASIGVGTIARFRVKSEGSSAVYFVDGSKDWLGLEPSGATSIAVACSGGDVGLIIGPNSDNLYSYVLSYGSSAYARRMSVGESAPDPRLHSLREPSPGRQSVFAQASPGR